MEVSTSKSEHALIALGMTKLTTGITACTGATMVVFKGMAATHIDVSHNSKSQEAFSATSDRSWITLPGIMELSMMVSVSASDHTNEHDGDMCLPIKSAEQGWASPVLDPALSVRVSKDTCTKLPLFVKLEVIVAGGGSGSVTGSTSYSAPIPNSSRPNSSAEPPLSFTLSR